MSHDYKQCEFTPKFPLKYKGTFPIFARSSWELRFMIWCDYNKNILQWSSESFIVPYISPIDNKAHKYYVDNHIVFKKPNGEIAKYLVEIKPERQTMPPVHTPRKRKSSLLYEQATYSVNQAKWKAAKEFAKVRGMDFIILTEKDLNI